MNLLVLAAAVATLALAQDSPQREASRAQERLIRDRPGVDAHRYQLGRLYALELLTEEGRYGPARDLLDTTHDAAILYGAALALRNSALATLATDFEKRALTINPRVAWGDNRAALPPPEPGPGIRRVSNAKPEAVRQVPVRYPPLARQARIQGTVRFNAVIDRDGAVADLQLLFGHPLLVPAATEAVKQWRYEPTRDQGEPVEVLMPITITFELEQ